MSQPQGARTPRPVVIDTDPGIDDALAILLALRSEELRVELLTTVAGNVSIQDTTANARRVLSWLAPTPCPIVAQGAARPLRRRLHTAVAVHGDDGLGGITAYRHADGRLQYPAPAYPVAQGRGVQQLLRMVERHGRELTVIALGPLTNIARAIQLAPEIMQRLGQLVVMGGAIGVPGNISPVAEFNIFADPHAADVVFRAGLPTTLVPLDVTRQVRLTRTMLAQASHGAPSPLLPILHDLTQHALQREEAGMPLHDPLAVAVAIDPSLVTRTCMPVHVETKGQYTLGMTVVDQRSPAACPESTPRLAVALAVDAPRVLTLLLTRLLAL
ncbi:MAG: nucleoside hydrolase [Candidatus Tectomicrobia bacterium]|uniref:Nucleoside hydrolase n=1 Tax=Tectimicrobiota bacterium TaxID=2528274 RepID=A0A937VX43_UNCTE|nr:nucleoside hydrolase [Candidatus Tectomicrobia bacterium]